MAAGELKEEDWAHIIHETNKHDEDFNDDKSKSVISIGLKMERKLVNCFLQWDANVEGAPRYQRDVSRYLNQYEEV